MPIRVSARSTETAAHLLLGCQYLAARACLDIPNPTHYRKNEYSEASS